MSCFTASPHTYLWQHFFDAWWTSQARQSNFREKKNEDELWNELLFENNMCSDTDDADRTKKLNLTVFASITTRHPYFHQFPRRIWSNKATWSQVHIFSLQLQLVIFHFCNRPSKIVFTNVSKFHGKCLFYYLCLQIQPYQPWAHAWVSNPFHASDFSPKMPFLCVTILSLDWSKIISKTSADEAHSNWILKRHGFMFWNGNTFLLWRVCFLGFCLRTIFLSVLEYHICSVWIVSTVIVRANNNKKSVFFTCSDELLGEVTSWK